MHDADQHDLAEKFFYRLSSEMHSSTDVMDLASALWAVSMDAYVGRLLSLAAKELAESQILLLDKSLREAGRAQDALNLCVEAAARHPDAFAVTVVNALRDAGRPVDGNRILESSVDWPSHKFADLLASLLGAGRKADVERVIKVAAQCNSNKVEALFTSLHDRDLDSYADTLLVLAFQGPTEGVPGLVAALRRTNPDAQRADELLLNALNRSDDDICALLAAFEQIGDEETILDLTRLEARRTPDDVDSLITALRKQNRKPDVDRLVGIFVANRAPSEVAALAGTLMRRNPADGEVLAPFLAQRPVADIVETIAIMKEHGIQVFGPLLSSIARQNDERLIACVTAFEKSLPEEAFGLLCFASQHRSGPQVFSLVKELWAKGLVGSTGRLINYCGTTKRGDDLLELYSALVANSYRLQAQQLLSAAGESGDIATIAHVISFCGSFLGVHMASERILESFAAVHSPDEIETLAQALRKKGLGAEGRWLRRRASRYHKHSS